MDIRTAFDIARPKQIAKNMCDHQVHGWIISDLLREMKSPERKATYENLDCSFPFTRCIRQGSVEAPRLWLKMAMQVLANVEPIWQKKKMGVNMDTQERGNHQICSFMWADNYWIMSHSKVHLEQMMKELIEEAERWDLEPKPASFVVDEHVCLWASWSIRGQDNTLFPLRKVQNFGIQVHTRRKNSIKFGGENAKCKQGVVAGREDLQK